MSAIRTPKRRHPEQMCCDCAEWREGALDWGECFWMAVAVTGDQCRSVYAYGDCAFEPSAWRARES